ncbi:MAG: helix-turn-helix domain-containing protein [Paludibacteraceae bacterium]
MNYQIAQIAKRLYGLRDALDLSVEEIAQKCGISTESYASYESGTTDIPMSFVFTVAQTFGVDTTELLTGETARASAFFVTRKGKGVSVERTKAYKYQALCSGFVGNETEIFEVTVEPNDNPITLNTHPGQEFNYVLKGTMQLHIAGNDLVLHEGDSIYFDASKHHGMKALNGEKVVFLAVIV